MPDADEEISQDDELDIMGALDWDQFKKSEEWALCVAKRVGFQICALRCNTVRRWQQGAISFGSSHLMLSMLKK